MKCSKSLLGLLACLSLTAATHAQNGCWTGNRVVYQQPQPSPVIVTSSGTYVYTPSGYVLAAAPAANVLQVPASAPAATPPSLAPAAAPKQTPPSTLAPCDSGTTPQYPPGTGCIESPNACNLVITPNSNPACQPVSVPTKFDHKPTGMFEVVSESTQFYEKQHKFTGTVCVPVIVEKKIEEYTFGTITIPLHCCVVTVCVPCTRTETISKECCLRPKANVNLQARVRKKDGTIDVIALGVSGMPPEWVVKLSLTKDEFKKLYGIDLP